MNYFNDELMHRAYAGQITPEELAPIMGYPEIAFEISEKPMNLAEHNTFIAAVESAYPGYKFNRTESRYSSCIMAIFEHN